MNKNSSRQQSTKSLKYKSVFSKPLLIAFALIFGAIGGYILLRSFAASPTPPTVYFTTPTPFMPINTAFSVQVRENSGATAVNAVQANFSYNASLVDFVSIDATGTAFTTNALSSGGSGTVSIARGIIGSVTGDQLIATVNFMTKTTGGPAVSAFTSGTALVSSTTNQDILGGLGSLPGFTVTIDTTPPTITPGTPADGAVLAAGTTVPITVNASDNDHVTSVNIRIDGSTVATLTNAPYTYNWNTTGVSLGVHTINAIATDGSGNSQGFTNINVTLADQTAPSTPGNFHTTATGLNNINLAWNASTDNVGVTGYRIQRNGSTVTTTASLSYSDTGLATNTGYSYTVAALDAAGNASTAASLNASTTSAKPGDLNSDNSVNIVDLSILLSHWATNNAASDINHDGTVNIIDLSILLSHYGT